jgi:tetratricopeptide (TPR) repeat protein
MSKLDYAYSVASDRGDYERALEICNQEIAESPETADGLDTRSRIYELMGDLEKAIKDITDAIDIDPSQPDYYFNRGRWHLGLGNYAAAVVDQTRAIDIGNQCDFQHYRESSLFFRAAAFLRLGMLYEALADCKDLDDDFVTYSVGLGRLSKAEITGEAKARLRDQHRG